MYELVNEESNWLLAVNCFAVMTDYTSGTRIAALVF